MRKLLLAGLAATLLILLPAVQARADQIDWTGTGKGQWATFSLANDPLGNPFSDFVGELTWNWIGAPPAGYAATTLYTYCVDATQYLTDPQTVTLKSTDLLTGASQSNAYVTALGGNSAGEKIAWLLDQYASEAHTEASGVDAAALQIAIWEVLYDGATDDGGADANGLSGGVFRLVNNYDYTDIYNKANSDLTDLALHGNLTTQGTFLDTASGQDQVFGNPTPEPASLILLGSGALALIARRRKRSAGSLTTA